MIDSYTATLVIIFFLTIFGIIIPILDKLPKIKNFISFRWSIVVIYSAMAIGVIIDFAHLDTSVRLATVIGGSVISVFFLIVRSIEKAAFNHWKLPSAKAKVKNNNLFAEILVDSNNKNNEEIDEDNETNSSKEN